MAAQLRELRNRIRSVGSIKKITKAQELIAASRVIKAQQRADAARPYSEALVRALEAAASRSRLDHPLLEGAGEPKRSAVLIVTGDGGFAGAYSSNVLREAEALKGLLQEQGQEVLPYVAGNKGVVWHRFRDRETAAEYSGFSAMPTYADARKIARDLLDAIDKPTEEGGVDEIHIVSTRFRSMVTQEVRSRRLFPIAVEDVPEHIQTDATPTGRDPEFKPAPKEDSLPLYDFEPSPDEVLDALLPQYAGNLVYTALLDAAASELAARRRAMKAAADNAGELQETLSRQANAARQAEITQEITEIVGGANALASAGSE